MTREAYSHEVISHGFWPGNKIWKQHFIRTLPRTAGRADTISQGKILPAQTFYSTDMKEFFCLR